MIGDTLYKIDSTGRGRFWQMERDGSRYRTISGLVFTEGTTSGWTQATAASQDTDEAQAEFEVNAKYEHQLKREYRRTPEEALLVAASFHEPMLAKSYAAFKDWCWVQPKFDGIRCIARVEGLFTRQGQPIVAVPHIHAALAPIFAADPEIILDGELYNHDFREDFGAISSIVRKKNPTADQLEKAESLMQYHVYDAAGSIAHEPFSNRTSTVTRLIEDLDCEWILPVQTVRAHSVEQADAIYGRLLEEGYEGAMFRCPHTAYETGKRSKALLKRKEFITQEFKLRRIEAGNGNWAGLAKRAVLALDDGREFGAGIRGSAERAKQLLNETYAEATVRFFCLSPDGVPRFPVVIDFHNGRTD